jgi:predicted transcriptional regulator
MNIATGTILWLYVKVPVGSVIGCVTVSAVHNLTAETLWRRFGSVSGLSKAELRDYLSGVQKGCALELTNPKCLGKPLSLEQLRSKSPGFQPPQFFTNISKQHALYDSLVAK